MLLFASRILLRRTSRALKRDKWTPRLFLCALFSITFCCAQYRKLTLSIEHDTPGLTEKYKFLERRCTTAFQILGSNGHRTGNAGALACVIFTHGKVEMTIMNRSDAGSAPLEYCAQFEHFFRLVSSHLPSDSTGTVFLHCCDGASFSQRIEAQLYRIGVPLATHSHIRLDDGSCPVQVVVIPDPHYIRESGFQTKIATVRRRARFHRKVNSIVWRGSTTGFGQRCENLLRVRFAQAASSIQHMDVKFVSAVQQCGDKESKKMLSTKGLMGERLQEHVWARHFGIIDITGNVHAYGLFWRLASGSVVLMVEDPEYRHCHMLSPFLKSWVHYVPLAPNNFSTMGEITHQLMQNTTKARQMQEAAYKLTQTLTLNREAKRVANTVADIWSSAQETECITCFYHDF